MPYDVAELDSRAVRASVAVVSTVTADDLTRPTPCAEWDLGALLAHMTAQHLGFAAAAAGKGADLSAWQVRPLGSDPVSSYAESAERVLAAFAVEGVLEREFDLPEISAPGPFPARVVIGFHLVDYVVHGWDVARCLGSGYALDEDVVDAALRVALRVPDGEARLRPDAAFGPSLPGPADGAGLDQVLTLLGRSPIWPFPMWPR